MLLPVTSGAPGRCDCSPGIVHFWVGWGGLQDFQLRFRLGCCLPKQDVTSKPAAGTCPGVSQGSGNRGSETAPPNFFLPFKMLFLCNVWFVRGRAQNVFLKSGSN